jgi:acetoin utilization deacetylase AcuC-like enzyme
MLPISLLQDNDPDFDSKLEYVKKNLVSLNHSQEYIKEVEKKCHDLEEGYGKFENINDIYYSKDSFLAALLCVEAVHRGINSILKE